MEKSGQERENTSFISFNIKWGNAPTHIDSFMNESRVTMRKGTYVNKRLLDETTGNKLIQKQQKNEIKWRNVANLSYCKQCIIKYYSKYELDKKKIDFMPLHHKKSFLLFD